MTEKATAAWVPYKLSDLGVVGRGRSRHRPRNHPSLYGGPYPFFQTGDIKAAGLYLHRYTQTYNEKGLAQSKLWEPGTLCITIAANIAETALLAVKGCFPDSVVGFVADPHRADVRFVKYYIDTIKLRMQSIARGTTQDNLSLDKLLTFDIPTPPLRTQRKIAAILSAYDDLIENNTRRIAILEEMAQAMYREWFVHFRFPGHEGVRMVDSDLGPVPQGWDVVRLGEVADVNASSIRKGELTGEIQYVTISAVSPGSIDEVLTMEFADAPSRARRRVNHGDIIWSTVRPNRKSYSLVFTPPPNLIVSTGFAVITPKRVPYTYLYQALTTEDFVGYLAKHATGAAYPAVNPADFKNAKILLPPESLAAPFHSTMDDLFGLKQNLTARNANLCRNRDLLLPRLVSGEVDVSELDIDTGGLGV